MSQLATSLYIYYIICILIDIISTIFYVLLLIFLTSKLISTSDKTISKEFFVLFVISGVFDLIFLIEEYINFRIPQFAWFPDFYMNSYRYSIYVGPCFTYSIASLILIGLNSVNVSINRLTAILYPIKYSLIWSGLNLKLLIAWPILVTIIFFFSFIQAVGDYGIDDGDGRMYQIYTDEWVNQIIWYLLIGSHAITVLLVGTINYYVVSQMRKISSTGKVLTNITKTDIVFVKYTQVYFVIVLFTLGLECAQIISSNLGLIGVYNNCMTVYVGLETVLVFFSPFTLVILSREIRRRFLVWLGLNKLSDKFGDSNTVVQAQRQASNVHGRTIPTKVI
uniref:Serpentine receptor class gamma n=1 Tax=Rhabditophanes sp. KR3021 TaxID=114890 RepID=A0AC35TUA9_9BILA